MTTPAPDTPGKVSAEPAAPVVAAPAPVVAAAPAPAAPDLKAIVGEAVNEAIGKHVAPLRQQLDAAQLSSRFNLDPQQLAAVQDVQKSYPGMATEKAVAFARIEKPDLFSPRGYNPAVHGSLPVGGDSAARLSGMQPDEESHKARYREAASKAIDNNNIQGLKRISVHEFARRIGRHR